jgi:toxin CcdB
LAQFDVYPLRSSAGLIVDCQSDLLSDLNTRFVVPLMTLDQAPAAAKRLNPVFDLGGQEFVMVTQFAAAVDVRDLGARSGSLRDRSFEVLGALDVLVSGV